MSQISPEDQRKIDANQKYVDVHAQKLYRDFAPTFHFHSSESSFPTSPDKYIEDVLMAKLEIYMGLKTRSEEEQYELNMIEKFFIKNSAFDKDYNKYADNPEFQKLLESESFLSLDERKYGYRIGEKVPIIGMHPDGKEKAPIYTSIFPTPDGFRIKYEYYYAISDAIIGTKWLYNILPRKITKKMGNLAVHAGDW